MSSQQSIPTAEDRISALPDSLLCYILSSLPTKLAVATSALSKRWKPLWKSVLTLDFDDESFLNFGNFWQFVYSVIISRDATLPLRSFRIRCRQSNNFNPRDFYHVVDAAVQRRPEIFELYLCDATLSDYLEEIPPSLHTVLNCSTLVVLKIANLVVYSIPYLVDLPLLKTLHLNSIAFYGHFLHFTNLLRGCPILEDFYINGIVLPEMCNDMEGDFKGFPNLVRANILNSYTNFPFVWLHNVKYLCAQLSTPYDYLVPTFHNLTHMELIIDSDSWPEKWKWVIQVLQHCPKLQSLIIDEDDESPTEDKDWSDFKTIPECLSSQLIRCSLRGYKGRECQLQFCEYILVNSKLLCTMTIGISSWVDGDEDAKQQKLVKLSSYPRGSVTCKLLFD